jgi:RimJ/RimL family protein N-acetyltransferase
VQTGREARLEQLQLSVTLENAAAMAVYAGLGFRPYGLERRALRLGPGQYRDEALLALDLLA